MNQEIELYDMTWLFFTTYLGFSIRFMQVAHDPFYLFIYIGYVSRVIKLYEMFCIKVMSTIFMHLEMQVNHHLNSSGGYVRRKLVSLRFQLKVLIYK